jgi:hypothetical protein
VFVRARVVRRYCTVCTYTRPSSCCLRSVARSHLRSAQPHGRTPDGEFYLLVNRSSMNLPAGCGAQSALLRDGAGVSPV